MIVITSWYYRILGGNWRFICWSFSMEHGRSYLICSKQFSRGGGRFWIPYLGKKHHFLGLRFRGYMNWLGGVLFPNHLWEETVLLPVGDGRLPLVGEFVHGWEKWNNKFSLLLTWSFSPTTQNPQTNKQMSLNYSATSFRKNGRTFLNIPLENALTLPKTAGNTIE